MNLSAINWLAVIAATLSAFVIGALWYSQILFGKIWMRVAEISPEKIAKASKTAIYGAAFFLTLIAATNLAIFFSGSPLSAVQGAGYGFLTGFGWVLTGIGVVSLFEMKKWSYILIHGFYWVVTLTVMGLIIAAWR